MAPASLASAPTPTLAQVQTGAVGALIQANPSAAPPQAAVTKALNTDVNTAIGYDAASINGPFATPMQILQGFAAVLQGPLSVLSLGVRGLLGGSQTGPNAINAKEAAAQAGSTEPGSTFNVADAVPIFATTSPLIYAGGPGGDKTGNVAPIPADSSAAPGTNVALGPGGSGSGGSAGGGGGGGDLGNLFAPTTGFATTSGSTWLAWLLILGALAAGGYWYWRTHKKGAS